MGFLCQNRFKLLNSYEPARPANTKAASKARPCAYLFAAGSFPSSRIFCSIQTIRLRLNFVGLAVLERRLPPQVEPHAVKVILYDTGGASCGKHGKIQTFVSNLCYEMGYVLMSETFQAAAIIEKLPPSWVDFKNYLKHKRKEMSVEDLVVHLRIEEDNRLAQKDTYTPDSTKANMIEHVGSSSRSNPKGKCKDKRKNDKKCKGKSEYLAPKAGIVKQKF
ncbi:hypothetical protein Tco_0681284 [Tanacetum coccineum]|uniref:Uncharacterized protein n=1 Tax=Tanacetum coccineum TaxID=301880 RepID=A0ABQ4XN40_9ASTR